jgi:hypothetical protein
MFGAALSLVTLVGCGGGGTMASGAGASHGSASTSGSGGASATSSASSSGTGGSTSGTPTMSRVFGNGLAMVPNFPIAALPMRVLVTQGGAPASNQSVAWAYTGGALRLVATPGDTPADTLTLMTDASGQATAYVWGSFKASGVTTEESTVTATLMATGATVSFLVTIVNGDIVHNPEALMPNPQPYTTIMGTVGQTLAGGITSVAVCMGMMCLGQGIKDVGVRLIAGTDEMTVAADNSPYAECTGIEELSDAKGNMTCDVHFLKPFTGQLAARNGMGSNFVYDFVIQ